MRSKLVYVISEIVLENFSVLTIGVTSSYIDAEKMIKDYYGGRLSDKLNLSDVCYGNTVGAGELTLDEGNNIVKITIQRFELDKLK